MSGTEVLHLRYGLCSSQVRTFFISGTEFNVRYGCDFMSGTVEISSEVRSLSVGSLVVRCDDSREELCSAERRALEVIN